MLNFELVKSGTGFKIFRARVFGGWLVVCESANEQSPTFVPDRTINGMHIYINVRSESLNSVVRITRTKMKTCVYCGSETSKPEEVVNQ